MLGITDFNIALVYILCIASTILCLIYGIINWNKGIDKEPEESEKAKKWEEKEKSIEESL